MKKFIKKYFLFNQENDFKPIQNSAFALGVFAITLFFSVGFKMINCYLIRQNALVANLNTIDIVQEINKVRSSYGLEPLITNPKLNLAATLKAEDMINKNYFDHQSPEGKTPWHWFGLANYKYKLAGENLALNFWNDKETVNAWLNSPTHRENILNPNYLETGVAILSGTTSTTKETKTVIVQLFGTEMSSVKKDALMLAATQPSLSVATTIPSTTTTTKTIPTTSTTLEEKGVAPVVAVNKIELPEGESNVVMQNNDELRNIASIINEQSANDSSVKIIGYTITKDIVNDDFLKIFDNGAGIGLLFLGIFGIINIHQNAQLGHSFRRKALLKNLAIFVIGVGLIVSSFNNLFAQIKTPLF